MDSKYSIKKGTLVSIADAIREKTGSTENLSPEEMPNGVAEVYQAGYDKGLAASGGVVVDPDKIIEKTVTGTTIRVDDVSEIPHKCTLSVDKDSSVKVCKKNLWDFKSGVGLYSYTNADGQRSERYGYKVKLPAGTYTAHAELVEDLGGSYKYLYSYIVKDDGSVVKSLALVASTQINTQTFTLNEDEWWLVCHGYAADKISAATANKLFNQGWNVQIELGKIETSYESYSEPETHIITAGQIIEIDSFCHVMSLFADNDATITFSYHKSWGMQSEYDRFWDAYQQRGNRTVYTSAFYGSWTDATYNPKYPIKVSQGNSLFGDSDVTDTKVPIDITGSTTNHSGLFVGSDIITIRKLIVAAHNAYNNTFSTSSLEDITFEGEIGKNISFSQCEKLTDASVQSIIDHLKDMTDATAPTLTFHATVGSKLTQVQKDTISAKNWTLAY